MEDFVVIWINNFGVDEFFIDKYVIDNVFQMCCRLSLDPIFFLYLQCLICFHYKKPDFFFLSFRKLNFYLLEPVNWEFYAHLVDFCYTTTWEVLRKFEFFWLVGIPMC